MIYCNRFSLAMKRSGWKNRGTSFSDLGVLLECGKRDLTTTKNVLHYVNTGTAKLMFSLGKELFFVPVMMVLKALKAGEWPYTIVNTYTHGPNIYKDTKLLMSSLMVLNRV